MAETNKFQLSRTISLENIIVLAGLLLSIGVGYENLRTRVVSLEEWRVEEQKVQTSYLEEQKANRDILIRLITLAEAGVRASQAADSAFMLRPEVRDLPKTKLPPVRTSP